MSSIEPLYRLIGIKGQELSKKECTFLEAKLFYHFYGELIEIFREQHKQYFRLMKFNVEMENSMLEENFIRFVIEDILSTKEYTLHGIAYYINIHEDVIVEALSGLNINPSTKLLRKVIELHCSVRPELYFKIIKKIAKKFEKYLQAELT